MGTMRWTTSIFFISQKFTNLWYWLCWACCHDENIRFPFIIFLIICGQFSLVNTSTRFYRIADWMFCSPGTMYGLFALFDIFSPQRHRFWTSMVFQYVNVFSGLPTIFKTLRSVESLWTTYRIIDKNSFDHFLRFRCIFTGFQTKIDTHARALFIIFGHKGNAKRNENEFDLTLRNIKTEMP